MRGTCLPGWLLIFFLSSFNRTGAAGIEGTPLLPNTFKHSPALIRDEVFLQEVGYQLRTPAPLTAIGCTIDGEVFAGNSQGLLRLHNDHLEVVDTVREPVRKLFAGADVLWALGVESLYAYTNGAWIKIVSGNWSDLAMFKTNLVLAGNDSLYRVHGTQAVALAATKSPFSISHLAPFNESLYLQGGNRISYFDSSEFGGRDAYGFPADLGWDWGTLPSRTIRDLLAIGPSLYIATDRGLGVLRGMTLFSIRGEQGLPYEDALCLAQGFTNDLWIGTTRGAIRKIGTEYHYFAGERWLPADRVNAMACRYHTVYFATDGGLASISYVPMTLAAKAAFYEKQLRELGQKRLGFVHKLEWDQSLGEYVREAGDNDGGYSSDYLSAQSYRYAVTGDPAARAEALNTFEALLWLERMTGIPGFPARAVWVKGEKGHKATGGSGGYPAEWHDVKGGTFEWKGDTSSDELCAHFYGVSLFLELAAQGPEIEFGRGHLQRMAAHLQDHDWQLIDLDGKPTRWGRWDPGYFLTDEGHYDRGLQCLEILNFMKAAAVFTHEARFNDAFNQLVKLGYPQHTLRQRQTFPRENVLHFEDQLAFWSFWNLLRHETDPARRSLFRRAFERTWEILRIEQQPWFNFFYGALTGNDCEPEEAVRHLREWPLDLAIWTYQNSHRTDLRTPPGYTAIKDAPRAFSPREREPIRWDAWTMQADGGTGGNDMVEPSGWLLAYWMGRYHGFISPPATEIRPTVKVQFRRGRRPGAEPYDGPARPPFIQKQSQKNE